MEFKDEWPWVVFAGLIVPSIYIFFKLKEEGWSELIPIAVAVWGLFLFKTKLNNNPVEKETANYGPAGEFAEHSEGWYRGQNERGDVQPMKQFKPPNYSGASSTSRGPPSFHQQGEGR